MEGPPQRPHVNPRMRHINPRGMNQNYGGKSTYPHELQHQAPSSARHWRSNNPRMRGMGGGLGGLQAAVDPSDWRTIIKILEAGGDPGTETQVANTGIRSTNEYQTAGLWQTWKKILERTGSEDLANQWLQGQQAV